MTAGTPIPRPRLRRLLLLTWQESFATILVERGIYFYTDEQLAFGPSENLGLALGFGTLYVLGALASHALCVRLGEKRVIAAALLGQAAMYGLLFAWPAAAVVVAGVLALGFLNGVKWPVVESYVVAGQGIAEAARSVGRFNLAWSTAVPTSLLAVGPILKTWPAGLFLLGGAINLVSLALMRPLRTRPVHLPHDHPERPNAAVLGRLGGLLASSRWSMITSYSLLWILAALMPDIFGRLQVEVEWATAASAMLDAVRVATFLGLQLWLGWHGRAWPLALVIGALPLGFFLVVSEANLATVLAGEVVFGVAAGMTYYAALYYAMVVKNASVDAGGGHEGLIGAGFTLGPVAGLAGRQLAPTLGGPVLGMAGGVGPLVAVCAVGAARPLLRAARAGPPPATEDRNPREPSAAEGESP